MSRLYHEAKFTISGGNTDVGLQVKNKRVAKSSLIGLERNGSKTPGSISLEDGSTSYKKKDKVTPIDLKKQRRSNLKKRLIDSESDGDNKNGRSKCYKKQSEFSDVMTSQENDENQSSSSHDLFAAHRTNERNNSQNSNMQNLSPGHGRAEQINTFSTHKDELKNKHNELTKKVQAVEAVVLISSNQNRPRKKTKLIFKLQQLR